MEKVQKVYKYGTGQKIPEGAVYLSTVKQLEYEEKDMARPTTTWKQCWLVWHYFLVEVEE